MPGPPRILILPALHRMQIWPHLLSSIVRDVAVPLSRVADIDIALVRPPMDWDRHVEWSEDLPVSFFSIDVAPSDPDFVSHLIASLESSYAAITNIFGGGTKVGAVVIELARHFDCRSVVRVAGNELGSRVLLRPRHHLASSQFGDEVDLHNRNLRAADYVWVMNEDERIRIERSTGRSAGVVALPRGVDIELFSPVLGKVAPARLGIAYVGRDSHEKGRDIAASTARILARRMSDVDFYLTFEYRHDSARELGGLHDSDRIQLMGSVGQAEVVELLRSVQLLVVPSRMDAMPQVVLEGMASGVCCLVSDGIAAETFPLGSVLRAPPSISGFVDQIIKVRKSPHLLSEIGRAGRELVVNQFGQTQCAQDLSEFFGGIL